MRRFLLLGLALGVPALALSVLWVGCGKDLPPAGGTAGAFDRVVLAELFTSLYCPNCPEAEHALDRLYEEEQMGKIAVIHWHPTRTLPDALGIVTSDDRYEAYRDELSGIVGLPTCVFDGVAAIVGGSPATYDQYRGRFESEALLAAEIGASLDPVITGNHVDVDIDIEVSAAFAARTLDMTAVLVEHNVPKPAGQPGPDTLSFVARVVNAQQITLEPGEIARYNAALTLEGSWNQEELYVVAIFQELDLGEVLQSAMAKVHAGSGSDFFSFEFSAPDTNLVAVVGAQANLAHIYLENTGTLGDTLRIDLPADYRDLPQDWSAFLCTEEGMCFTTPYDLYLDAGQVEEHLVIDLFALSEGQGWVGITVQSVCNPALADTLRIHFTTEPAGSYAFTATAPLTDFVAELEETVFAHILFENTGEQDDRLTIDIVDDLTTIPPDWALSICDDRGFCIGHHLELDIAAGESVENWGIDVIPYSEGSGQVGVTVASTGDPSLTTTLIFTFETAGSSPGFARTVLGEMFTTWWCTNCPIAEEALDTLHDEEGAGHLAVIHWHPYLDDIGGLGIPETDPRLAAYTDRLGGPAVYPTTIFDGEERIISGSEGTYDEYRASYEAAAGATSSLQLLLQAERNGDQTIDATIQIESVSHMPSADLDLHVVVVEHETPLPMIPIRIFSYTARRAIAEAIRTGEGATLQRTVQFEIDADWNLEHVHVVAFVQMPGYGEVVQAAMIALP